MILIFVTPECISQLISSSEEEWCAFVRCAFALIYWLIFKTVSIVNIILSIWKRDMTKTCSYKLLEICTILISSVSDPNNSIPLPVYYFTQPNRKWWVAPRKFSFKYKTCGWRVIGPSWELNFRQVNWNLYDRSRQI